MSTNLIRRSVRLTCLLCLIILSVSSTDSFAQSVAPQDSVHWVGVDTGFAMAKETGKPVFLWFYGSWCGYSKKMLAKVFPDSSVIATLNASFVPIKVETASKRQITYQGVAMTESEFAMNKFNARSVPSTWFVEPNGCRILHLKGYRPVSDLVKNLDYVHTKQYGECQNVSLIDPPKIAKPRTDSTKTPAVSDTTKK
jgi:thioredoxin-related protein